MWFGCKVVACRSNIYYSNPFFSSGEHEVPECRHFFRGPVTCGWFEILQAPQQEVNICSLPYQINDVNIKSSCDFTKPGMSHLNLLLGRPLSLWFPVELRKEGTIKVYVLKLYISHMPSTVVSFWNLVKFDFHGKHQEIHQTKFLRKIREVHGSSVGFCWFGRRCGWSPNSICA